MQRPTRADDLLPADTAPHTQTDDDGFFEVSVDSNPLALEPRRALVDDRRWLHESIVAEKAANDVSIAATDANAFDSRSSHTAAWAVEGRASLRPGGVIMS